MSELLRLEKVTVRFGGLVAVSEVDFHVAEGELVGLIGPNGAGKTTLFNLVTGVYTPTTGRICLGGREVDGLNSSEITGMGVARTFQNIRLFNSLSVLDNVIAAFNLHLESGFFGALWRGAAFRAQEAQIQEEAMALLEIFGLREAAHTPCRSLPYGDQRRLEIVRALATRPKLLLLDEPAAGMNPTEKIELMRLIRFTQERFKLAVLLVEHDMKVVMGICERIAVLEYGRKIAEGTPTEIQKDKRVIAAYLGEEVADA
ncbi:MAG: branched-chain amino acid transport system ATP-binding protein [Verrucomicrobia bacterium]|nr:MAG: branched-chain amino acid transport system ATP-binding protein [Verrucomicrobiota bacterium]